MKHELKEKEQALAYALEKIPDCVLAFSGGLDSTYLAMMASKHVPGRVICVTVADASTPECDLESARDFAAEHGLEHIILVSNIHPDVRKNTRERCYICKLRLFQKLGEIKEKEGLVAILDGENASDSQDDRPGSRAARECGILSLLAVAGLTKDDIRVLARDMGLESWSRPASACLSSRIPFGTEIDDAVLRKVDATEQFIRSNGIGMIRARVEGDDVRLELGQGENTPENRAIMEALGPKIMSFGWKHMEVDPSGYIPAGLRRKDHGK
jgi:uncharacterized protein